MTARVDPTLLPELKRYGAVNIEACFNCGTCTAVCPLTNDNDNFPRRLIRYAQIGLKGRLAGASEVWLCYFCGECSATCPRQAEPGEFMAAVRRYVIASYDMTGLSKRLYQSAWFNAIFTTAVALFAALFLWSFHLPVGGGRLLLFEFIPEVYIQVIGFVAFGIIAVASVTGLVEMTRAVAQAAGMQHLKGVKANRVEALRKTLFEEALGHKRYRNEECEEERASPLYIRKWFVHATVVYGFLGLFAATALDFLFKPVGSAVPLYYPTRLLGTCAGLLLMYGTGIAMFRRLQKRDKYTSHSHHSDWTFLILLWLVGLSGFLLEIAVYALLPASWGYMLLIVHVALAIDLLVMLPFSKFAHIVYRTMVLYLHNLQPAEQPESEAFAPAD